MANRIPNTMTTLRKAVEWIATEDPLGDNEDADAISGYLTVHLAAHLFDTTAIDVAKKVVAYRRRHKVVA